MVDNLAAVRALFIGMSAAVACILHARICCKQQAMLPPGSGLMLGKQPCASMAKRWTTASMNFLTVALSIYLMSGLHACSFPFCGERVMSSICQHVKSICVCPLL